MSFRIIDSAAFEESIIFCRIIKYTYTWSEDNYAQTGENDKHFIPFHSFYSYFSIPAILLLYENLSLKCYLFIFCVKICTIYFEPQKEYYPR